MNESELISAFHGSVELNSQVFFGYISLMSGVLVLAWLAAHKLPSVLAAIVVTLFSVVSALLVFRIYLNGSDAAALMSHMMAQQALGNMNFAGFGSNPLGATPIVMALEMLSTVGGFLGCITFFFYRRRSTRGSGNPDG
jgi:hypothetical protein